MTIVCHMILPGVSRDQYDAVRAEVNWLQEPPAGRISHITWWEGDDCHNLDSCESEASFAAFGEGRLGPALAKVGVQVEPQAAFHQPHEVFVPRAVTITTS